MDLPSPAPPLAAGRHPDSLDEGGAGAMSGDPFLLPLPGGATKLRLMCSYGGHITPRPHDNSLCYVGGDTRIVVVDRNSPLSELLQRLSRILLGGRSFTLKYQLPSEDLDSLITVSSEEDLDNMIDEYDRLNSASNAAKPSRIRLFLFPAKLEVAASMGPILDGSNKSDEWFLNALNGATILQRGFSDPAYSLLELNNSGNIEPNFKESEAEAETGLGLGAGKGKIGNLSNQDVHSIPDSPVVETSSSFGSTSSSPSLTNLPPIRVQVDGARVFDHRTGIDEHFANMGIGAHKQEDSFAVMSSHPNLPSSAPAGDYTDRIISDDERSDHGVPVGFRKPPQPQTMMLPAYQPQHKQMNGDLLSPDSIASDSSLANASSRQKLAIYQESFGNNLIPPNFIDPNSASHIQIQPVSNSGYMMQQQPQYELHPQQQPQYELQPQQQQSQQYIQVQTSNQYVHHLPGGVPVYYVPAGQQPPNQPPVYYVPAAQNHPAYNFPVQQPNCAEVTGQPQNLKQPNPTLITPSSAYSVASTLPSSKAEITQAVVYSTTTNIPPQLVQVPSHHQPQQQPQFVGYSQVQHPTAPPPSSVSPPPSYAYELADPVQNQLYFTQQPLAPQMAAQYQTMTSSSAMAMSDVSSTEHVNPQ